MSIARHLGVLVVAGACADKAAPPAPRDPAPAVVTDAGVAADARPAPLDPSGMHLDPYVPSPTGRPAARPAGRAIEIMLRSTPSGARVAVDGLELGVTPQLWQGQTGEHEFTFRLGGHALARYRFHVITTGVVHARLDPVAREVDAGKPPPELVPPGIAPPSTIVDPLDGSPRLRPDAPAPAPVPRPAVDAGPSTGFGPEP